MFKEICLRLSATHIDPPCPALQKRCTYKDKGDSLLRLLPAFLAPVLSSDSQFTLPENRKPLRAPSHSTKYVLLRQHLIKHILPWCVSQESFNKWLKLKQVEAKFERGWLSPYLTRKAKDISGFRAWSNFTKPLSFLFLIHQFCFSLLSFLSAKQSFPACWQRWSLEATIGSIL